MLRLVSLTIYSKMNFLPDHLWSRMIELSVIDNVPCGFTLCDTMACLVYGVDRNSHIQYELKNVTKKYSTRYLIDNGYTYLSLVVVDDGGNNDPKSILNLLNNTAFSHKANLQLYHNLSLQDVSFKVKWQRFVRDNLGWFLCYRNTIVIDYVMKLINCTPENFLYRAKTQGLLPWVIKDLVEFFCCTELQPSDVILYLSCISSKRDQCTEFLEMFPEWWNYATLCSMLVVHPDESFLWMLDALYGSTPTTDEYAILKRFAIRNDLVNVFLEHVPVPKFFNWKDYSGRPWKDFVYIYNYAQWFNEGYFTAVIQTCYSVNDLEGLEELRNIIQDEEIDGGYVVSDVYRELLGLSLDDQYHVNASESDSDYEIDE